MASRHYQNFDLLIENDGEATYRARVTGSPLGESPSARFTLPFTTVDLQLLLMTLDPGRSGVRRAAPDPQSRASMDLGGPLFDAVFSDAIMLAWSRSQDAARAAGEGLRLRLRLTDAPELAGLPWELLYDRRTNSYIAQSERTPVVRYLEVPQPPRPLAVSGALRVLTVIASPEDQPPLDVDREWRHVQDALAPRIAQGSVRVDRLPEATMPALREWLRRNEVHVLHFIGHGDFDSHVQDGVLLFTDRYGRSIRITPSQLGPHLRDHDPLRLVVLNACHSARVDATDPFSGMAQGLIQQDCAAVVAMQFPISDSAATTFAGEFYGALADGFPVDQAATSARKALMDEHAAEWATPVVFLRAPDGQLFTDIVADPDARVREAAQREAAEREAARQEAARQEWERAQQEAIRQEAARREAVERERVNAAAAREEAVRQERKRAQEQAAREEWERAQQDAIQQEAARREAAERDRVHQEHARDEAARLARTRAQEQAAQQEWERAQQDAIRQETARREAAERDRARLELERQELERQDAARKATPKDHIRFMATDDPKVKELRPWYRSRAATIAFVVIGLYLLCMVLYGVVMAAQAENSGSGSSSRSIHQTALQAAAADRTTN